MSHGYWPVTHVTHTGLLTHVTHDPLTHCQLWSECQITFLLQKHIMEVVVVIPLELWNLWKVTIISKQTSSFYRQMLFLSPNQRYQDSEGKHKPSTGHVMSTYYHQRIYVFALEQETLVHSDWVVESNHISVVTWLLTDIWQGFTKSNYCHTELC